MQGYYETGSIWVRNWRVSIRAFTCIFQFSIIRTYHWAIFTFYKTLHLKKFFSNCIVSTFVWCWFHGRFTSRPSKVFRTMAFHCGHPDMSTNTEINEENKFSIFFFSLTDKCRRSGKSDSRHCSTPNWAPWSSEGRCSRRNSHRRTSCRQIIN